VLPNSSSAYGTFEPCDECRLSGLKRRSVDIAKPSRMTHLRHHPAPQALTEPAPAQQGKLDCRSIWWRGRKKAAS
jgi:hypothetical protein